MAIMQQEARLGVHARFRSTINKFKRLPWFPIIILLTIIFVAVFAKQISPFAPDEMNLRYRLKPPGTEADGRRFLLGTDTLGRDLLSRIFSGAQVSLLVATVGLLFGGTLGLAIGIVSGYFGGTVDALLMRLTDAFLAIPTLLIALVFSMTIGPGILTVMAALSLVSWSRFSRIIRSEVLLLKERAFILQAKVAGCSSLRIMLVHILPNVFNTFLVLATLQLSQLILIEATLSFLGAGIVPPTPTWGNMIDDGRNYIMNAWWISMFPGIALSLTVYSFNTLGDWLRDRLDPKLRQL
jgi:peptide/nickel transport system permease protein